MMLDLLLFGRRINSSSHQSPPAGTVRGRQLATCPPRPHGVRGAGGERLRPLTMYCVYCLLSIRSAYRYVGFTEHPEARLRAHNRGKVRSTRSARPYHLYILREADSLAQARRLEQYFKSGFGRKHLDRLFAVRVPPDAVGITVLDTGPPST